MSAVELIGVGNAQRGDDGAGLELARRLAVDPPHAEVHVRAHAGDPLAVIDLIAGADAVVFLDAVRSGAAAGTVRRWDVSRSGLPAGVEILSSHAVGLGEVVELARALGRLPPVAVVYGIDGQRFGFGEGLTRSVRGALQTALPVVRAEAAALADVESGDGLESYRSRAVCR